MRRLGLLWQAVGRRWFRLPPMAAPTERQRLLRTVRAFWIHGVLRQSPLRAPAPPEDPPLEVDCLARRELIVQNPGSRPSSFAPSLPITRLWEVQRPALLILGSPGSGKTTLLLELTEHLLNAAEQDLTQALPVVFDLSDWRETSPSDLADWLLGELHAHYGVSYAQARRWLKGNAILPLLDGFDEVDPALREHCLQAVEAWLARNPARCLALCALAADYEELTTRLRAPGAIVLQPLTQRQISRCLENMGEPAAVLSTASYQDPALWEWLRTPLMLGVARWLGRTQETSIIQITGTVEERRAELWDRYLRYRLRESDSASSLANPSPIDSLSHLAESLQGRPWLRPTARPLLKRLQPPPVDSLEEAARLGLLIKMGPRYRFLHRTLQDHLATRTTRGHTVPGPDIALGTVASAYSSQGRNGPGYSTVPHSPNPHARIASPPLLQVDELKVSFGASRVVENLSFSLQRGETLGVVGESGSGKSLTALALLRLPPPGATLGGHIRFAGQNILALPERELEALRGRRMAMIFQEPMTALNPVLSVGEQIAEMFILHQGASGREAQEQAVATLKRVHIADPARRAAAYPHQLSGGMRQRVMIAMALACKPDLLIADEPTTALDVTVQAHILDLMLELQEELGMAMLFISHNLGVVAQMADRVLVMYAGRAMEVATTERLLRQPMHPYTRALLATLPRLSARRGRLPTIPGNVPRWHGEATACVFAERCSLADERCRRIAPSLRDQGGEHWAACLKIGA